MPAVESSPARKAAVGVLFAAYLLAVSWDTLKAHFSEDEMLAIWTYWHPSPWRLLSSQFMMWRGYFRPMAGFFFLPTFEVFGLNPAPYHAVLLVLLIAGAYLMYRLARVMGCGELGGAIVALIACYHGGLNNLYYNSVFVFDVLCGLFYFAALAYYIRIRSSGRLLNGIQTAIFLLLFLCCQNSKEMALTMPLILLIYEWLFPAAATQAAPPASLNFWLKGPGRIIIWSGLMNLVALYGKRFGSFGLLKDPSYQPAFTWARFLDFQERYIGDIFYSLPRFGWAPTLLIWIAITYICWRRNRPMLRFCWFFIAVTPIPLMFIIGRDQACLYVPLAGWGIIAATLVEDCMPALVRLASKEAMFQKMPPERVRTILAAALMVLMAAGAWSYKVNQIEPGIPLLGQRTAEVLAEFRAANPQVKPGAKVIFQEDPFPASFDAQFIAELWFHNRKTRVWLNQKTPLPPEEFAGADAIFTWREGKLVQLR